MKKFQWFIIVLLCLGSFKLSQAKKVKLSSKDFQKEFLDKVSETMKQTAQEYLNNFLLDIKNQHKIDQILEEELNSAIASKKLEAKFIFIKQYLDMEEHKDANRDNMYALRNVLFLKKLKDHFYQLQEESLEEMHQLRYFYLCKQFKVQKETNHHNYYSKSTNLVPILEQNLYYIQQKLALKGNLTISVDIKDFGKSLYKEVNDMGASIIDDYLVIIRKLLLEVLEPPTEEEATPHSEALKKILLEIEALLKISDFYTKRQRLYDYLQNHLALDYEQFQNSETSQHDLMEVFSKLKEKGLDLVVAYLFSNFEFIDYLQDHWRKLLPYAPLSAFDEQSRILKQVQDLYVGIKEDFENSTKYDEYLKTVKLLHEQTQQDNTDTTHIYEMLYSASQNVGSSRSALMNAKCNEI